MNGIPVSLLISTAIYSANPSNVLIPVPTAVPPYANSLINGILSLTLLIPFLIYVTYPENSYPKVIGVAS